MAQASRIGASAERHSRTIGRHVGIDTSRFGRVPRVNRRGALVVIVGALITVLFAAITTAGAVRLSEGPPSFFDGDDSGQRPTAQQFDIAEFEPVGDREPREVSPLVEQIARLLGWTVLAIAAIAAAIALWRVRPTFHRRRRRRASSGEPFESLVGVAATVTDGAAAQRAALERGNPRNAIVECWLLLEAAVADAGVQRRPSDTSAELTERVLVNHDVDATALADLAARYREARFSDHEISEGSRTAALDALDRVHDSLGSTNPSAHRSADRS